MQYPTEIAAKYFFNFGLGRMMQLDPEGLGGFFCRLAWRLGSIARKNYLCDFWR